MQRMIQLKLSGWLLLIISCLACHDKELIMNPEPVPSPIAVPYTYLALGDSYTIGESVATENRWTYYLTDFMRQSGIKLSNPITIARTGWTTADLQEAIRGSDLTNTYDLVTLLIGVNNQYCGQSLETYRLELRDLLHTSVKLAANQPSHVLVLSIPDWGVTPFAQGQNRDKITQEIEAFNAIAKEECQNARITFVDITPTSRQAAQNDSYVASDNLHFSGKMYAEWANIALPAAKVVFGK